MNNSMITRIRNKVVLGKFASIKYTFKTPVWLIDDGLPLLIIKFLL